MERQAWKLELEELPPDGRRKVGQNHQGTFSPSAKVPRSGDGNCITDLADQEVTRALGLGLGHRVPVCWPSGFLAVRGALHA